MKGINVVVEKNKTMRYEKLNILCLLYLCAWALIPVFAYYTSGIIFRIVYAGVVVVWTLTGISNTKVKYGIDILSMLMFFIVMLIHWGFGYGDMNINDFINYILLFGFAINANVYAVKLSLRSVCWLKRFFFICIFITTVTTTHTLMTNVNASRYLTSSSVDENVQNSLQILNVGSFDYIYGILISLSSIIINARYEKKYKRLAYLLLSLLIVICIVKANFTIAYILLLVSALLYVLPKSKSILSKIMTILTIFLMVFITPFLLEKIFHALMNSTTSIYSQNKLESLLGVLNGTSSLGDTSIRFSLMKMDIDSFLSSPLFGVGGYYRTSVGTGVGQHSQLLDELARYGIFGVLLLFFFIVRSVKHLWNEYMEKGRQNPLLIPTMMLFGLSLLNPMFNDGILVCYFAVIPIMLRGKEIDDEDMLYN